MTDDAEIQAALTPEEWARFAANMGRLDIEILKNLFDGRPHITIAFRVRNGDEIFSFEHGERHALAALCLHGQPFGFTQEDVELLRRSAENELSGGTAERLSGLADRIAALLPPSP